MNLVVLRYLNQRIQRGVNMLVSENDIVGLLHYKGNSEENNALKLYIYNKLTPPEN